MRKNFRFQCRRLKAVYAEFVCGSRRGDSLAFELSTFSSMSCSLMILKYLALKIAPFFFELYSAITCGWVQWCGSVEIRSSCENNCKILEMCRVLFTDKYYGESTSPLARCCLAISQTCINVPYFTLKWSLYYFNKSRYCQTKLFYEGRKCFFANTLMLTGYCFFQT